MRDQKEEKFLRALSLAVFVFGFCVGMVTANQLYGRLIEGTALFAGIFVQEAQFSYLWYLCRVRALQYGILAAAGCFRAGKGIIFFALGWIGYSMGLLLAVAVGQYSLVGLLLFVCGLLPQMLFYVPAFLGLWYGIMHYNLQLCLRGGITEHKNGYLRAVLFGMILLILGILAECYLNPALMRIILKKY